MPHDDTEEAARDIFKDAGQDFAALIRRLNDENVRGRAGLAESLRTEIEQSRQANTEGSEELAKALRAEIGQSRQANSQGREKLAKALRTEIEQVRAAAGDESKAALKALLPSLLWKLLGGVAAMLAVFQYLLPA